MIDENNILRVEERESSIFSSHHSERSSCCSLDRHEKRKKKGRPTTAEQLQNEFKKDKLYHRSLFGFFTPDKT